MKLLFSAMVLAAAAAFSAGAAAQAYPSRAVHIIVPTSAGGGNDFLARLIAPELGKLLGQPVVVENRPGASMIVGTSAVAKAAPDGYTLLLVHDGPMAMNPIIFPNLPYDPQRDFVPLSLLITSPYAIIVHPSLGVNSVSELVAYARANPGKLNHASGGPNTVMAVELFSSLAGVQITSVLYKGLGPAVASVMSGETQMSIPDTGSASAAIRGNRVKVLAVTTLQRSSSFPGVPTVAESGVPGYENSVWIGMFGPAGLPGDIARRLGNEFRKVITQPELRGRLDTLYMEPVGASGEALGRRMAADHAKWARLVKERGIKFTQ